jgi:protein-S-isoprenylcysteine O-methyltransferase Ste14
MDLQVERIALVVIAVAVYMLHVNGARATFKTAGDRKRLSPPVLVMMIATLLSLYNVAFAEINPRLLVAGCAGLLGAAALFEWARRSIRGRTFTVFFTNDVPQFVWTGGPYAYVRHPFYTSYLLSYASVAIALRSVLQALLFFAMLAFFWTAAAREERKFANSSFAAEYAAYRRKTGRFVPRLIPATP